MKKFVIAAAAMFIGTTAFADSGSGTLQVTGTVASSVNLTIQSAGGTTGGTGTGAATSALGTFSKYGTTPTGFTLARGASSYTLSSTIGVRFDKANLASTDYTLTAQLQDPVASGVTWKLKDLTVSDSGATTLTSSGTYNSTASYNWDIVIADSAASGTNIDNTINFTATSN
ncbi:MAG: hypothetical protein M3Q69_04665 [Acidobacteriota bacterium]|nr:hypothetical protein [Acidobacteriota bacterium]